MRAARVCATLLLAALLAEDGAHAETKAKMHGATCRSVGTLKFDADSHPMQRIKGLEVCSKYRKNTCCDASHAHALRLKIREPVVAKFSRACQRLTEEMACAPCHPLLGTGQMKNVCPSTCDAWFSACKDEYYAYSGAGTLAPCYGNALVCSPLSSIANSGADFCEHMGFHVGSDADVEGLECFDGSVPKQLGAAEPTEPWDVKLQRLVAEEMENPSGGFIVAIFAALAALYLLNRFVKQLGDPFGAEQLSLEEIRRLQQERYERGEPRCEELSDSSSSSDEEGGGFLLQRIPRSERQRAVKSDVDEEDAAGQAAPSQAAS